MKGQKLSAISKKVMTDIFAIWNMAKIPTITKINAKIKLEKMYNKWLWLQKSEKKETEKEKQNRAEFTNCFPKLFDITSPTWETEIKNDRVKSKDEREEDLQFLLDQRGERKEWLGSYSKHYQKAYVAKERDCCKRKSYWKKRKKGWNQLKKILRILWMMLLKRIQVLMITNLW